MKRYLILIGAIIFMSLSSKSQTCVFDLTTGTDVVGNIDPIWEVRTPVSVTFVPVTISSGSLQSGGGTIYPNAYVHDTCGQWISPHLNAAFHMINVGVFPGIYTYQEIINIDAPCGIDSAEICFDFMAADNTLDSVRVNGTNYPPPAGITHLNPGTMCATVALISGANVIEVDVNNWGAYTGLQLCGELTVHKTTCIPEGLLCCDAPAGQVLSWIETPGAVGYEIEFFWNDPYCCEAGGPYPPVTIVNSTENVFIYTPGSGPSDCFSWRVRAIFADDSTSEWSEKECSCVPEVLCPTPIDLDCSINSAGIELSWTPVITALYYDVMINYNDPYCCPVGGDLPYSMIYETTDNFYVVPGFYGCFSWRVRTHCRNGEVSEWSDLKCCSAFSPANNRTSVNYDNISTSIVPNPANEFVTITITDKDNVEEVKNASLAIFDISGKEVLNSTISLNESKQIDVSHFNSGIYILKVIKNGKLVTSDKLVIQ